MAGKRLLSPQTMDCGTIMRMRPPDRIREGTELPEDTPRVSDPHDHADRDLAYRLAHLPSSHPSARLATDRRNAEYRETELQEWWRPAAGGHDATTGEPDDIADEPDDGADEPYDTLPSEDAELDESADQPDLAGTHAVHARAGRRGEPPCAWGELAGASARSPYRPWFSADEAGDPWFAVRATTRETSSSTGPGG
jgi:hypothetical protein